MKERPILFSGPMVLAIKEGRKTQTRRIFKLDPMDDWPSAIHQDGSGNGWIAWWGERIPTPEETARRWYPGEEGIKCPYGQLGDRLWVRESWATSRFMDGRPPRETKNHGLPFWYNADLSVIYTGATTGGTAFLEKGKNRQSIHMPRWASRITLEIVSVRVERLRDISRKDAKAEGFHPGLNGLESWNGKSYGNSQLAFEACWKDISGPGSWEKNPFVWVVEFRQV